MNVLEMTDSELYEIGLKVLTDKLGASGAPRFILQCQPGKENYSVDRHKLLADQPDIDTIAERIRQRRAARAEEARERGRRFASPQSEIQKMTDLEIYEIGSQILIDKLGVAGLMAFIGHCQELNGGPSRDLIRNKEEAKENIKFYTASLILNPRIIEDYIKRGNAYSYIGAYDTAIADYDKAVKLKPNYAKAYYKRGETYCKRGEYNKAIADYNAVIKLDPEHVEAYHRRSEAQRHLKERNTAEVDPSAKKLK